MTTFFATLSLREVKGMDITMKRRITMISIAILLCIVFLSSEVSTLTTFAGHKSVVVGKTSFSNEISTELWNCPEDDVVVDNGRLIFTDDSTEETRLITTAIVRENQRLDELFHASITMKLTSLPENEKFSFAFGLPNMEAYQGSKGNVEISFSNQKGVMVEVLAYADGDSPTEIVAPTRCGAMKSNISIEVVLMSGGKLTLKVGNKTLCAATELPVSGEGNLGFVQTGNCGAQISDMNLVVHQYDAPQNCNIEETFDTGAMNTSVFSSKTIYKSEWYPQSLSVQEYDGNHALRFERCGLAYVGTNYEYSNFEMTFDVLFLQRAAERDESGKVVEPKQENFVISIGGDSVDHTGYGYTEAADAIVFYSNSHIANYSGEFDGSDPSHLFCSSEYPSDKAFSVKLSVIDGVVTVGIKWLEEHDYSTVLNYTLSNGTPTGYVHLWSPVLSNMWVDNIKIINKDIEPELIEVEYTCASFDRIADYTYEESELVFRDSIEQDVTTKDDFKWYNMIACATISGVVILVIGFGIGQIRRRKNGRMGGKHDET